MEDLHEFLYTHTFAPISLCVKCNENVNSNKFYMKTVFHVNPVLITLMLQHGRTILRDIMWLYVNFN